VLLDDAHYGANYPKLDCAMQEKFCAMPQGRFMKTVALGQRWKEVLVKSMIYGPAELSSEHPSAA
jgi:hypothetical protein